MRLCHAITNKFVPKRYLLKQRLVIWNSYDHVMNSKYIQPTWLMYNNPLQPFPDLSTVTSIKSLELGTCKFDFNSLPLCLENLWISDLTIPLPHAFMNTLRVLCLDGDSFNEFIHPGLLPSGLHTLSLGGGFCTALVKNSLPQSLQLLELDKEYKHSLAGVLPDNLSILVLPASYPGVWGRGDNQDFIEHQFRDKIVACDNEDQSPFVATRISNFSKIQRLQNLERSVIYERMCRLHYTSIMWT